MTAVDDLVGALQTMTPDAKRQKVKELKDAGFGLFSFDERTRLLVWIGVFVVFAGVLFGAFMLIWHGMGVNITTTTATGANTVTSTTHPDMSAAWAAVSAVTAGVVGILVPSPRSSS
jgi:hypothetical protein